MTGEDLHRLEIVEAAHWPEMAGDLLAGAIQGAIDTQGRCLMGVSGGATSADVFDRLAGHPLDWDRVVVVQLDERIAPWDRDHRFVVRQQEAFAGLPITWLGQPVDDLVDLDLDDAAASSPIARVTGAMADRLIALAGDPPILDIVQLGLGRDGHTMSLFGDDPALTEMRRYVALTSCYQGYRRLTLTRPVLDRARLALWLVRGPEKAVALGRLLAGDVTMPAGLVRPQQSLILADTDAVRQS